MELADVHTKTVIIAAIVYFVLGIIGYTPWALSLFKSHPSKKSRSFFDKSSIVGHIVCLITSFIIAYVLAQLTIWTKCKTFASGAQLGFWIWLGFIFTAKAAAAGWGMISWKMAAIQSLLRLISLVIVTGILAHWR